MSNPITKSSLRDALGFTTDAEIAAFFGITAAAVSQWGEDAPIPELRRLQFELKRPGLSLPCSTPPAPADSTTDSRAA